LKHQFFYPLKTKIMKKKHLLIGAFIGSSMTVFAQQDIVSTQGDSYSNSNNTIDFTIGEPVIETVSDGTNDVTQGFHQTQLTITSVKDYETDFILNVFPNPTAQLLNVKVQQINNESYQIFDINGKLVLEGKLSNTNTVIDMAGLAEGTFILSIVRANQPVKSFQIIKQ
tara:strand:- start:95140 stop:95646 length:507 start_codon:yes stop_codon:yes gene_type:complete